MDSDAWFWLAVMTAVVFGAATSMFGVWTIHRRKELLLKHAHNERMSALEKGVPLPEFPAAMLGEADAPSANATTTAAAAIAITLRATSHDGVSRHIGLRSDANDTPASARIRS